ncbi:hypothetical protein HK097_003230 [Rhizophlyctis rosea]|uniref:SHSP domain-containing protein n=1 Tax=Rhizophlyctis rosea TaxID=64517 RepID=A0AAD5SF11_9FUNG|nr:hypothetical protein HK097_003230 [Rhizophlyctis rosea]
MAAYASPLRAGRRATNTYRPDPFYNGGFGFDVDKEFPEFDVTNLASILHDFDIGNDWEDYDHLEGGDFEREPRPLRTGRRRGGKGRRAAARMGRGMNLPSHVGAAVLGRDEEQYWRPAADIFVSPEALVIHVDLPGVPKNEIQINLKGTDTVIIEGNHQGPKGYESATARVRERNVGKFQKVIRLPTDCDTEKITSAYQNGLLEIKVPKKEESKARKIDIDGGDEEDL